MQVMSLHHFYDDEIEKVRMDYAEVRELVLKETNEGAILINKNDVIALAKEFGLVVYDKDASL